MRITILKGQVVMIETSITPKKVELLKAIKPSALSLKDEEGNEFFSASVTDKAPSLSTFGVIVAKDQDITIVSKRPVTEDTVRDQFGSELIRLGALEAQVESAVTEAEAALGTLEFEAIA